MEKAMASYVLWVGTQRVCSTSTLRPHALGLMSFWAISSYSCKISVQRAEKPRWGETAGSG